MPFLEHTNPDVNWRTKTLTQYHEPFSSFVVHSSLTTESHSEPKSDPDSDSSNDEEEPTLPETPMNPQIHLVDQLNVTPEDKVYLFHVYCQAVNTSSGLLDVYHDLADV